MASSVDIVTFVRESMVRICEGLELDTAVWRGLEYLRQHLPVEQILLTAIEAGDEHAEVWATSKGGRMSLDQVPTGDGWGEILGWGERDVLLRRLVEESSWQIGAVYFVAAEGQRLGPVQMQLLAQLDGAFTVALGNHLQHKEALKRASAAVPSPDGAVPDVAVLHELEPILTRALAICQGSPAELAPESEVLAPHDASVDASLLDLDHVVAAHIRRVLRRVGGRVEGRGGAAELLGVNPSTLRKRMRKLEIPYGRKARAAVG
jgi:Bacterial regulatory protein, Fis family